jgi:hypothetical protein
VPHFWRDCTTLRRQHLERLAHHRLADAELPLQLLEEQRGTRRVRAADDPHSHLLDDPPVQTAALVSRHHVLFVEPCQAAVIVRTTASGPKPQRE